MNRPLPEVKIIDISTNKIVFENEVIKLTKSKKPHRISKPINPNNCKLELYKIENGEKLYEINYPYTVLQISRNPVSNQIAIPNILTKSIDIFNLTKFTLDDNIKSSYETDVRYVQYSHNGDDFKLMGSTNI